MRKKIVKIKSNLIGILSGIVLGVVLLLAGCGSEETTESGRVVETIDSEGNVIDAGETDEAVETESDKDEVTESADETKADASGEIGRVEESLLDKDYLKYMSEDELRALAVEALQAAGKDTRLADGRMRTKGVEFDLPEGYEPLEGSENFYVNGRYPIDAANVMYAETEVDYTLQLMDKDYFKDLVKEIFSEKYNRDIEPEITEFKEMFISAVPTFRLVTEYDIENNHMIHLMYIINGSKTYCIVYTETADYDRMELFEESAKTIRVKR